MVDEGQYFTIIRTRQYGKTTTLNALEHTLENEHVVIRLDFLAQLRGYYIRRTKLPTFHSVILSGVYDVKNMKRKTGPDEEKRTNSPWNITAHFDVTMSFSKNETAIMLRDYENNNHAGMNVNEVAEILSEYTSGYPYLVSRIWKLTDEKVTETAEFPDKTAAWTMHGILESVRILLAEKNTLFESLMGKVQDLPDLRRALYNILFGGQKLVYNPDDPTIDLATIFGFIRNENGTIRVANRIFEIRLYKYFLTTSDAPE